MTINVNNDLNLFHFFLISLPCFMHKEGSKCQLKELFNKKL